VGLFAVFECGMMQLKTHVFDALDHIGGQCAALYPQKPIYDIPAYQKINGQDLTDNLKAQAAPFNPTYHLSEKIVSVQPLSGDSKSWLVTGEKGTKVECKAIIIAAGVGAFVPNRPPLANIQDFEGSSIFYSVKDPNLFKNKTVVIAGGGDSAVDWALSLAEVAEKVYVVHRRDKFTAAPESVAKMKSLAECSSGSGGKSSENTCKLELVIPYQLSGIEGEDKSSGNGPKNLKAVIVKSSSGEERSLPADYLLPFYGLKQDLGPICDWGLNITKNTIEVDATAATNHPGIYAIGDIASYPHKLKLILTGFAEAAQAARSIRKFLFPNEIVRFEHSTTQGVPSSGDVILSAKEGD